MDILILGGTAWLGRELARTALERGHRVSALARGESGEVAEGTVLLRADRSLPGAYDTAAEHAWDAVIDVSWQPGFVRDAVAALGDRARHWSYVSSGSVYADHESSGADESAELLAPLDADVADGADYGEAKVACEAATTAVRGSRALIVRPGVIGGPGDASGRSGYYVARSERDPHAPMLVPDIAASPTQVIDVRDLVAWHLDAIERGLEGVFNAFGPQVPFGEWLSESRAVGEHRGCVERADSEWLLEQGVRPFMGDESLPLWLPDPAWSGFMSHSSAAAEAEGLVHRPRRDLLKGVLAWERTAGLDRARPAGLSRRREQALIAALDV